MMSFTAAVAAAATSKPQLLLVVMFLFTHFLRRGVFCSCFSL